MSLLLAVHTGKTQCPVDSIPQAECFNPFNGTYCYNNYLSVAGSPASTSSGYSDEDTSYQLFDSSFIMLQQATITLWEASGYSDGDYSIGIWIDFNNNSVFENNEMAAMGYDNTGSGYISGTFFVPGDAVADTVKFRLIKFMNDASVDPSDACGDPFNYYGEVEDYYAIIQCAVSPAPAYSNFETTCEGVPPFLYVYTDYGYINWYTDTTAAPDSTGNNFEIYTWAGDTVIYFEVGTTGCNNNMMYWIDVHTDPSPVVIISGPDSVQSCTSEIFTANPGLDNYYWNTGTTTQSINITSGFGGILSVSSVNSFGCYGSDAVFVQIAPQPPSAYVTSYVSSPFCVNGQIVLIYDSLTSPGTVDWYDSTLNYMGSGQTFVAYEPGISIHNFTAYINSICGLDTAQLTIITEGPPSLDSIYSPDAIYDMSGNANFCNSGDITFIALNLSGTIDYWEITDVSTGNSFQWPDNNDTVIFPGWMIQPGMQYSIYAVMMNAQGCVANSDTLTGSVINSTNVIFPDSILLCPFPASFGISIDYDRYNVLWNTGDTTGAIFISTEGMYTLAITDEWYGCDDTDSAYVMDGNVTFDPFTDTTLVCADDITLFAGNGFTYYYWEQWDEFGNFINSSNNDNFYVSMNSYIYAEADTYGGTCVFFDTTYVMIAGPFSFSLGNDVNSTAGSFFINGPGGMSSYQWNTGATTENLTVTTSGTYYLTAINPFGCEYTDTIVVNFLNGITEWNNDYLFSIYPNPSDEYVFIETAGEKITQIEIYSVNGSLIESISVTTEIKTKLDIASLENGTYLLKVITENSSGWGKMVVTK